MVLFIIVILILDNAVFSHSHAFIKCCKSGDYLNNVNSTYQCTRDDNKRLGVFTNESNFLETHTDGECVDVSKDFAIFTVNEGNIVGERPAGKIYFPKCCPLAYYYDSVTHSCRSKENLDHPYITQTFVKVGLVDCKIIRDYEFNSDDLESYVEKSEPSNDFCIDEDETQRLIRRSCEENIDICKEIKCIKKCCPDGKSYINGANCKDTYIHGLNLSFSSVIENPADPFAVISDRTCKRIFLMSEKRYIFSLDKNGIFKYWHNMTNSFIHESVADKISYCIEHSTRPNTEGYFFFHCYEEKEYKQKFQYTFWPKVLSCIFLVLTILIYLILNEIRHIFGKILVNYCLSALLLFSMLIYAQVDLKPTDGDCKFIAFSLIFLSTASFAWLNVMCWDIWLTFGSTKQSIGAHQRRKELKRMLWYLLYGWGTPTLLTLIIFLFSRSTVLPLSIQPFVGNYLCFFEIRTGNYAVFVFLRLPHLIIQVINTVLFVKTIMYCLKIKNEINKINDTTKTEQKNSFNRDKERLSLILKLAVIMGVTYIFDAMSSFFIMSDMGTFLKYVEIAWDCINCSQGILIFIIFICKKKVYSNFLRKFGFQEARQSTNQQSTSSSTRFSVLSKKESKLNPSESNRLYQ